MTKIPIKYIDTRHYIADISIDESCGDESPADTGRYELVIADRRDSETMARVMTADDKIKPSVKAQLKAGTAFLVDKYEHSNTRFYVHTERRDWDITQGCAVIFLDKSDTKGKTYDERQAVAERYLDEFSQWYNGEIYQVSIRDQANNYDIVNGWGLLESEIDDYIKGELPDTPSENIERVYIG